eukprot:COSAG01_NODE_1069_length_11875_cov_244.112716_6_plen_164_part_00
MLTWRMQLVDMLRRANCWTVDAIRRQLALRNLVFKCMEVAGLPEAYVDAEVYGALDDGDDGCPDSYDRSWLPLRQGTVATGPSASKAQLIVLLTRVLDAEESIPWPRGRRAGRGGRQSAHVALSDSSDDEDEAPGSLSNMMAAAPSAADAQTAAEATELADGW